MSFEFQHPDKQIKDPNKEMVETIFRALNKREWERADRGGYPEATKKRIRELNRHRAEKIVKDGKGDAWSIETDESWIS